MVLATVLGNVLGMAAQGNVLYVYTELPFGDTMAVFGVNVGCGGAPTGLVSLPSGNSSSFGRNLAVNATDLFWARYTGASFVGELDEAQVDGGDPTVRLDSLVSPVSPVLDATNLYWADYDDAADGGSIWKLPLAGGPAVELASAQLPALLAVDATHVYWTTNGLGVQSVGIDGGPVSTLAPFSATNAVAGVAVDSSNLYFGSVDSIEAVPLDGGPIATLAGEQSEPEGIVLDGTTLYWTNQNAVDGGSVMKLPLGCPSAIQLAGGLLSPSVVVVDATSVYWASPNQNNSEIMRLPK